MFFNVANPSAFDIAHHFGHRAFEHLSKVVEATSRGMEIASRSCTAAECHPVGNRISLCGESAAKACIDVVINFSAMMEASEAEMAIFGNLQKDPGERPFRAWRRRLTEEKVSHQALNDYLRFKGETRDLLMHANPEALPRLALPYVHEGVRNGWEAWRQLSEKVGMRHDDNSWEIMCTAHGCPPVLSAELQFDLSKVVRYCYRMAIAGFGNAQIDHRTIINPLADAMAAEYD